MDKYVYSDLNCHVSQGWGWHCMTTYGCMWNSEEHRTNILLSVLKMSTVFYFIYSYVLFWWSSFLCVDLKSPSGIIFLYPKISLKLSFSADLVENFYSTCLSGILISPFWRVFMLWPQGLNQQKDYTSPQFGMRADAKASSRRPPDSVKLQSWLWHWICRGDCFISRLTKKREQLLSIVC